MLKPLAPPRRSGAERTVKLGAPAPEAGAHQNGELMTSPDRPKRRLGRPPLAEERVVCGRGRNPTFSPPRVTVLRLQDARTFWPFSRSWP